MFKTPKIDTPTSTVPTSAAVEIDKSVNEERRRQQRKQGRMSTILLSDYMGGAKASDALGG